MNAPAKFVVSKTLEKPLWRRKFTLTTTKPYPSGVVGLHYDRAA
jgi:hypothetical protein